jgi:hypothetical protein
MTEVTPIWRQALKDEQHPLHRAAWILFSENPNPQYTDHVLADQKEQVIEFIYQILDTDELYLESSLGSGNAPINGVKLLGKWQVVDAIPHLLKVIEEDDDEATVNGAAYDALREMGSAIYEPIMEFDERTEHKHEDSIAGIVADACKGDPRVFDYVRTLFEKKKNEWEIAYHAENLLVCDPEQAIPILEERLSQRKYSKDLKKRLEKYIADAKAGIFP